MNRLSVILGLAALAAVAFAAVWFMSGDRASPRKSGESGSMPALSGEVGDDVTRLVLARLAACQDRVSTATCSGPMEMRFRIVVRSGRGRVEALRFDSQGLAPAVDGCFRAALERLRFDGSDGDGQLEVSFPVLCNPEGRIHLLEPHRDSRPSPSPVERGPDGGVSAQP